MGLVISPHNTRQLATLRHGKTARVRPPIESGRGNIVTIIAYDGKTLASDRRALSNGAIRTTTKIRRIGDLLVGASGDVSATAEVFKWVENGRISDEYPKIQKDKDSFCCLMVIEHGEVYIYEMSAQPTRYDDKHAAIGNGRDLAIAAMHCGRTAEEAVEIASIYDASCGNGVDTLI